jgi:hypothetical protein
MKNLCIAGAAFLGLGSLLVGSVSVSASVVRTNTASFSYSRSQTNPNSTQSNTAQGYRGTRTRVVTEKASSFADSVTNRSTRTVSRLRKSFSNNTSLSATSLVTQDFLANAVSSFAISLPQEFEKESDTLTWDGGKIIFSTANTTITISALGNICEGGTVFVQDCLNKQSDMRTDEIRKQFPSGIVLEKKVLPLRETGEYRFDQANVGKWFLLDAGDTKKGVLTFFDSEMEYLWRMEISSPDTQSGFLNNDKALVKMKKSLFQKPSNNTVSARIIQRAQKESTTRSRSGIALQRKTTETFSAKDTDTYTAQQVPFTVRIPKGFSVLDDSLTLSSGKIHFTSSEGSIEIMATDAICSDQSFSVERECIEKFGAEEIQALKADFPAMTSLGTENYRLSLTTDTIKSSIARGILLMNGSDRASTTVFAEPTYGNMWQINIISHSGQRGVLGDARQFKELITSLRFRK